MVRSPRVRLLMLATARWLGMRYVGVYIDPVLACNLRCRMCHFSDPAKRPRHSGAISKDFVAAMERNLLPRAAKLQIGCGAEPTVWPHLPELIAAGKRAGVPYIEITTNGQLLTEDMLRQSITAGLNGIVLSLHGTTRATYEYLMDGARFDRLMQSLSLLRTVKRDTPNLNIRINYTANNMNKAELVQLWSLLDGLHIDVLQVRPIQRLGDTAYSDFEISDRDKFYNDIILPIAEHCRREKIVALLPGRDNLEHVDKITTSADRLFESLTYCYVSPQGCYDDDYDVAAEPIESFQMRSGRFKELRHLLCHRAKDMSVNTTKKLNYK